MLDTKQDQDPKPTEMQDPDSDMDQKKIISDPQHCFTHYLFYVFRPSDTENSPMYPLKLIFCNFLSHPKVLLMYCTSVSTNFSSFSVYFDMWFSSACSNFSMQLCFKCTVVNIKLYKHGCNIPPFVNFVQRTYKNRDIFSFFLQYLTRIWCKSRTVYEWKSFANTIVRLKNVCIVKCCVRMSLMTLSRKSQNFPVVFNSV